MTDFSSQKASEQVVNPVKTGLNNAYPIELFIDISSNWKEAFRLDVKLLQAICHLSIANPEQVDEGFTPREVVEKVSEIKGGPWSDLEDKERISRDVRIQWNNLLETWEAKKEGVVQKLAAEGADFFPELKKTEGGGAGNPSRYRIEWHPLAETEREAFNIRENSINQQNASDAAYICEDIQSTNTLVNLFANGYQLHGWRKYLYISGVGLPLLFGWVLLVVFLLGLTYLDNLEAKSLFNSFFALATFSILIWKTIGPLIRLPEDQIVLAPWWLQSDDKDRLLERRAPPRYQDKSIKAVRYTAKCPVCGGKVHAKSGGLEFWRRIVGRCENSPREHVFSFDHVTRRGTSLR